jgi:hypothetical protein
MLIFALIEGSLNLATSLAIADGDLKSFFKLNTLVALIISIVSIISFKTLINTIGINSPVITMLFSVLMYTLIFKYLYSKYIQEAIFLGFANVIIITVGEFIAIPLAQIFNFDLLMFVVSVVIHITIIITLLKTKLNLSKSIMFSFQYRELDISHKNIIKMILAIMLQAATVGASLIALSQLKKTFAGNIYIYIAMLSNVLMVNVLYTTITRTFALETAITVAANYEKLYEMEVKKNEKSN